MPHFIAKRWPNGDLDIVKRDATAGERVHVFTEAELEQHDAVVWNQSIANYHSLLSEAIDSIT